ncbi:MAG: hypothetical protein ACREEP_18215, partial [Dongiaceae bacterium]
MKACAISRRATAAPVFGHDEWASRDDVPGCAEFGAFPLSEGGKSVARCLGIDHFLPFEAKICRPRRRRGG